MKSFKRILNEVIDRRDAHHLYQLALDTAYETRNDELLWLLRHLSKVAEPAIVDEDDRRVTTASITHMGSRFYIRFNAGFIRKYIETPQCLLHLVLHELGHKVRGDLFRPLPKDLPIPLMRQVHNVVADAMLDAELQRLFFRDSPVYLEKLYSAGAFFSVLLSPPDILFMSPLKDVKVLKPEKVRETLIGAMTEAMESFTEKEEAKKVIPEIVRIYQAIWLDSPSFDAVEDAVVKVISSILDKKLDFLLDFEDFILLGDHEFTEDEWFEWLGNLPGFKGIRPKQAGYSNRVKGRELEEELKRQGCRELYEAIRRAVIPDPSHPVLKETMQADVGVIPYPERRTTYLLAGGYYPVFFPNPVYTRGFDEWKVHLYLDVSGSVEEIIPFLFGLIIHLKDCIGDTIYGFSNKVFPIALKDLEEEGYKTTGGTDFDCIAEHALQTGFKRILVITDGHAGFRSPLKEEVEKKVETFVLLTEDNPRSEIIEIAGGRDKEGQKWWIIPENLL